MNGARYEIYCSEVDGNFIGGPFAVYAVRIESDGTRHVSASCTFIRDAAHCNERAREYARSYNAPIINPIMEAA